MGLSRCTDEDAFIVGRRRLKARVLDSLNPDRPAGNVILPQGERAVGPWIGCEACVVATKSSRPPGDTWITR
jgi:hypothetical protein